MYVIMTFVSLGNTISINKSHKYKISVNMDWHNYFKEQINKSSNHPINKVNDFTGNQTGGFIRPSGNFLREQSGKLTKLTFLESL